jgi:hypothetical protein
VSNEDFSPRFAAIESCEFSDVSRDLLLEAHSLAGDFETLAEDIGCTRQLLLAYAAGFLVMPLDVFVRLSSYVLKEWESVV